MAAYPADLTRALVVTGLRNAHAVEQQALALMDRQLDRLQECDSGLKEKALSIMGNLAALGHGFAEVEIPSPTTTSPCRNAAFRSCSAFAR